MSHPSYIQPGDKIRHTDPLGRTPVCYDVCKSIFIENGRTYVNGRIIGWVKKSSCEVVS